MAAFNLASYLFGSGSDVLSATDIYLDPGVLVNTGRGDDSITGTGNSGATSSFVGGAGSAGISIGGTLHTDQ